MIRLRVILIASAVLLIALAFPLQVLSGMPEVALLPYGVICVTGLLLLLFSQRIDVRSYESRVPLFVGIFLMFVLINNAWFFIMVGVDWFTVVHSLFIYALPALFFWFFRYVVLEREIRITLVVIVAVGFANGFWLAYDSYQKQFTGEIARYSRNVYEYALMRGASQYEAAAWWLTPGQRSVGLLESYAVSSAWVAFGCFAALALIPWRRHYLRAIAILTFGCLLIIGMNFTAGVAFALVIAMIELRGYRLLIGQVPMRLIRFLSLVLVTSIVTIFMTQILNENSVLDLLGLIASRTSYQIGLIDGSSTYLPDGTTYLQGFIAAMGGLFDQALYSQASVLIGDFITSTGRYGGDFGLAESVHILGVPLFFMSMLFFLTVFVSTIRHIGVSNSTANPSLFGIAVIAYVVIVEVHYGIWRAKSVLPMIFIALALLDRCPERVERKGSTRT